LRSVCSVQHFVSYPLYLRPKIVENPPKKRRLREKEGVGIFDRLTGEVPQYDVVMQEGADFADFGMDIFNDGEGMGSHLFL
jgi:hypothetical protein